jgi:hypothetical protein
LLCCASLAFANAEINTCTHTPQTNNNDNEKPTTQPKKDGVALDDAEQRGFFRVGQYGKAYTAFARINEMMLRCRL